MNTGLPCSHGTGGPDAVHPVQGKRIVWPATVSDHQQVPCTGRSETLSEDRGTAPSVFIGSFGYPDVEGGPLLIDDSDHPPDWLARNLRIEDVVGLRVRTIRGRSPARQFTGNLQEIALSSRPLDVDVAFSRPVSFAMTSMGRSRRWGSRGRYGGLTWWAAPPLNDLSTGSLPIPILGLPKPVSNCPVGETMSTASQKLMTSGLLGRHRHFVPTRWGITAVDDTLSTALKKEIAGYPPLEEYPVLFRGGLCKPDCLHPCPGGLAVRDDRGLGETDALGRGY